MNGSKALQRGYCLWLVTFAFITACRPPSDTVKATTSASPQDILVANLDTSINPGDDFFMYANGGWIKRNPIPPSESTWGLGSLAREELNLRLRAINEAAAQKTAAPGTDDQKIGDFWTTAMDESRANSLGLTPLQTYFDKIDSTHNLKEVLDAAFALHRIGVSVLFEGRAYPDETHSDEMAVHLEQGGLGLSSRELYFNPDVGIARIRAEYGGHLRRLLVLLGADEATATSRRASAVIEFETALAKVSRTREELLDSRKNYYRMTPAQLQKERTPIIDWMAGLHGWNVSPTVVIVGQPEFFSGLEMALRTTAIAVLRDYLKLHLVTAYAPYLSRQADNEVFAFYRRALEGQKEPQPRWKRVLDAEHRAMGMLVGRRFVRDYFPETAKRRYADLVEAIRGAFHDRIDALTWMSVTTKANAQQKLAAVVKKVGYPDNWKDYSALIIGRASFCDNMLNAARWKFDDNMSRLSKPVNREEWAVTPQTLDAYYRHSQNDITLPAAVFAIPGVKDSDLDDAIVYGNAGMTIGHEFIHGFDNDGRQYDAAGNLVDWWTDADAAQFQARTALLVRQFDAYEPLPGLHINGQATLGENIADHGLLLALDAFKKTSQYRSGVTIGGLTPLQRFFLGVALGWVQNRRDEVVRRDLVGGFYAPPKWRVNGVLSNVPEFYEAFGIKENEPMWRASGARVHIW